MIPLIFKRQEGAVQSGPAFFPPDEEIKVMREQALKEVALQQTVRVLQRQAHQSREGSVLRLAPREILPK